MRRKTWKELVDQTERMNIQPELDRYYACVEAGHPRSECQCLDTGMLLADWISRTDC